MSDSGKISVDVAILFALQEEFGHLFEQIKDNVTIRQDANTGYYDYFFDYTSKHGGAPYRCLTTFSNEMGPTAAALMTERIVRMWHPATMAFVGIGGGISDDVLLGDVVVATCVDSYLDRAKAINSDPKANESEDSAHQSISEPNAESKAGFTLEMAGEPYRTDPSLQRVANNLKFAYRHIYEDWLKESAERRHQLIAGSSIAELESKNFLRLSPEVVSGHIASGPIVSAAKEFLTWLKKRDRSVLCIEMESAGFLASVFDKIAQPTTIVLRGISDFGDSRKSELDKIGKGIVRKFAATNAIDLLFKLVDTGQIPRFQSTTSGATLTEDRFDSSERTSIERCASRWEALQVPAELARELARDKSIGGLSSELRANVGAIRVISAPMGSGKTLAAERLFQEAIRGARSSSTSPLPVFIDCNALAQSLEASIREQTNVLGDPAIRGVDIVVDELNQLSLQQAIDLISQAKVLSRRWPNTRCHLFGRPRLYPLTSNELSTLPELSERDCVLLIARISQDQQTSILQLYPQSLRRSLLRPSFAVMTGVYRRNRGLNSPTSRADLFVVLCESALGKMGSAAKAVTGILSRIAIQSVTKGKGLILKRDLPLSATELDAVQSTGLVEVIRDGSGCRFALPILAEWYAAQAIINNEISTKSLIKSQPEVERWRNPLAIAIGTTSFDIAAELLRPIAEERPAYGGMIVDDAIASWGLDGTIDAPPMEVCAEQLRKAMSLWLPGLGPLVPHMKATNEAGELRDLTVSTDGPWLSATWRTSNVTSGQSIHSTLVVQFPHAISTTLGGSRSARPGNTPAWALRWTQEDCVDDIDKLLKDRNLKTGGAVDVEAAWNRLRGFAGTQTSTRELDELDITSLYEHAKSMRDHANSSGSIACVTIAQQVVRVQEVIDSMEKLIAIGTTTLRSPWPGPDIKVPLALWPANQYSTQQLLNRISQIYGAAMSEYRVLVEKYFPKFADRLWTYAMLPARFTARVDVGDNPSMQSHFWPLPTGSESLTDVQLIPTEGSSTFDDVSNQLLIGIANLRADSAQWLSARFSNQLLFIFGQTPVADLVYKWLQSDLHEVNWSRGM